MTPEDAKRIEDLQNLFIVAHRESLSHDEFWKRFDAIAGDLDHRWSTSDDGDLIEAYTEVLANADDAGYIVPEHHLER